MKGFKLPDIRLSKFDGNALEWNNWVELYQRAIGKNPRISPVEKITYLQTLCTGSAKILIDSYGTNSSQYDQAIEELIRRFGNPKFIVAAYIKQLEDSERPHLRDSLSFVINWTFLRKLVHNFEANGQTFDLGSTNLSRIARSKLSSTVLMKWEEFCVLHGLEYATLIDFSNWFNNYSKACESLDLQIGKSPPVKTKNYQQHDNKKSSFLKKDHSASDPNNPYSIYRSSTTPLSIICLNYQGNHYLGRCPEFKRLPLN